MTEIKDKKQIYIYLILFIGLGLLVASFIGNIVVAFVVQRNYLILFMPISGGIANLGMGVGRFFGQFFAIGFWSYWAFNRNAMSIVFNLLFYVGIALLLIWVLLNKNKMNVNVIVKFLIISGTTILILNVIGTVSLITAYGRYGGMPRSISRNALMGLVQVFGQLIGTGFWRYRYLSDGTWGVGNLLIFLNIIFYIFLAMLIAGVVLHKKQKKLKNKGEI
ncbi:MAG: hypothetical protein FWE22_06470 [Firmicutes bacterium]|nr:hypothetical protein [Bacillota bacterium]